MVPPHEPGRYTSPDLGVCIVMENKNQRLPQVRTCRISYAYWVLSFVAAVAGIGLLSGDSRAFDRPVSRSITIKGVALHYVMQGAGEPVVLIHGLYSSADINWRFTGVMVELAKDHQVIALDMPGHGRSDKPNNEEAYGIQIVDDLIALLDNLKIKKAHIVGYSLGGMVAMKFLALHQDRVISAVVGGMGWFRQGSGLQKFWEQIPAREEVKGRTPSAFLRAVGQLALSADELKRIRVPAEILVGDRDPVKPLYVVPLRPVRKDWPIVEIEGAGHINCIVKKSFRDEIAAWVRKHRDRSSDPRRN